MPVRVHTFDSFGYRSYVFLWLATAFSSAGYWLQQVVVGWLAYEITQSAFWTSLALGLDALPILLAGPVGGVLVDNFDRRKMLAFIYGYQAIVTTVFAGIVMTGNLEAWHIFAFIFFMGLAWVVSDPARMSLIPNIVPRKNLINAFALSSMAFSVTRLVAPALGGVLIAVAGPGPTLALEAALQICAISVALCLRVAKSDRPSLRLPTVFSELREGVRYVLGEPVLIGLFTLTAMPALLVMPSIQGLMPVYAAEVFNVDAKGLGVLMSAVGAGSTLGTFVLASKGDLGAKNVVLLVSMSVLTLATAVFLDQRLLPHRLPEPDDYQRRDDDVLLSKQRGHSEQGLRRIPGKGCGPLHVDVGAVPVRESRRRILGGASRRSSCDPDCGRSNAAPVHAGRLEDQDPKTAWLTGLRVSPCLQTVQFRAQASCGHRLLVATDAPTDHPLRGA